MDEQNYQTTSQKSTGSPLKKIINVVVLIVFCIVSYNLFSTGTMSEEGKKEQAFQLANTAFVSTLSNMGLNVYWQTENDKPIYTVRLDEGFQLVNIEYVVNSDTISELGDIYITYSARLETKFQRSGNPAGAVTSSEIITGSGIALSMSEFESYINMAGSLQSTIDGLNGW